MPQRLTAQERGIARLCQPGSCQFNVRCLCLDALGCCAGAVRALERVADKALQLGEAALCGYRSHSSSQCKNAALLHYAVSARPFPVLLFLHKHGQNPSGDAAH